jgi:hypothetical protein
MSEDYYYITSKQLAEALANPDSPRFLAPRMASHYVPQAAPIESFEQWAHRRVDAHSLINGSAPAHGHSAVTTIELRGKILPPPSNAAKCIACEQPFGVYRPRVPLSKRCGDCMPHEPALTPTAPERGCKVVGATWEKWELL